MPFEIQNRFKLKGIKKHGKLYKPEVYEGKELTHQKENDQKEEDRHHEDEDEDEMLNREGVFDLDLEEEEEEQADAGDDDRVHAGDDLIDDGAEGAAERKGKKISERRRKRQAFLKRNKSPKWRAFVKMVKQSKTKKKKILKA